MKTNKEPFDPLAFARGLKIEMPNTFEGLLPWIINTFNPNFMKGEGYDNWSKIAKGFDDRMEELFDERNELAAMLEKAVGREKLGAFINDWNKNKKGK